MSIESWKVVGRCHNYEVSSLGRIRRITGRNAGHILSAPIGTQGYPFVQLWDSGKALTLHVHVLVAEAFVGPRPSRLDINHIDGTKTNNEATNLEYVTRSENMRHAVRIGLPVGCAASRKQVM